MFSSILSGEASIRNFKFFSGYTGWSAGQLEDEIQKKCWIVADPFPLDYLLPTSEELWKSIMRNLGGENLLWANAPKKHFAQLNFN